MDEYCYRGKRRPAEPVGDLPLFAPAPANHRDDPASARAASARVRPHLTAMQQQVLLLVEQLGPITGVELEEHRLFRTWAPSSVRKRLSELAQAGCVVPVGARDVTTAAGRRTRATAYRAAFETDGRAA